MTAASPSSPLDLSDFSDALDDPPSGEPHHPAPPGLFHSGLIRRALVVGPRTLLTHWIKELSIVGLSHMICNYYGSNKNIRDNELQHAFKEGGILLTTYDIVRINYNLIRDDKKLPKKNELIIWLKLTDCQRRLYKAFLNHELVPFEPVENSLAALTVLKKICDHPLILTQRDAEDIFKCMDGVLNNHDTVMVEKMAMNLKDMAHGNDAVQLSQAVSCKLSFILSLLRNLLEEGHHVLIFSQTCTMLDMIQDIYELFSMPGQGFDASLTQKQLQEEHGQQLDMDESLREHIQFLEKQGIAGVSHHSLLFSETEILPMLSENDGPGRGAHGKPKDVCFTARTHLAGKNTDSDITEEINRLSETLGSTAAEHPVVKPERGAVPLPSGYPHNGEVVLHDPAGLDRSPYRCRRRSDFLTDSPAC
ncbi:hypothetical protein ZWY2020_016716 [Hordeum vulgare]|nr:hypothetical protein ZWY2020_016716 [Hordeum vulgare]